MKLLLLPFLSALCMSPVNKQLAVAGRSTSPQQYSLNNEANELNFQDDGSGKGRMACIAFKSQEYCRAELEDFDFDFQYTIVSATAYFSGANFKNVEKGFIKGASLKPIKSLMERCLPGTTVVFDDIKVKGSDDRVRTISGMSLLLY